MPKANRSGVRGLSREKDGRWHINLRWTDRKTGKAQRHHERLPPGLSAAAAKARARAVLNAALDGSLQVQKAKKGNPERLQGQIFGGLLDALVGAMRLRDRLEFDRLPRLADFARWGAAAALGYGAAAFVKAMFANVERQITEVVEGVRHGQKRRVGLPTGSRSDT